MVTHRLLINVDTQYVHDYSIKAMYDDPGADEYILNIDLEQDVMKDALLLLDVLNQFEQIYVIVNSYIYCVETVIRTQYYINNDYVNIALQVTNMYEIFNPLQLVGTQEHILYSNLSKSFIKTAIINIYEEDPECWGDTVVHFLKGVYSTDHKKSIEFYFKKI